MLANVGFANLDKVANRLAKAALNPLPTPQAIVAATAAAAHRRTCPGEGSLTKVGDRQTYAVR